jgi:hypothetical protein
MQRFPRYAELAGGFAFIAVRGFKRGHDGPALHFL